VSGETTAQTILRLDNDVISLRPSIVVVEVGINDLKTIGLFPNLEQQITNSCFANLNTLVIRMTEHGIHVVVLTIIPPGRPGLLRNLVWSEAIYTAVERVNATIKNLQGRRITVVDCAQVMCIGKRVKPQYARDTLHLNSAGYEMLNTSLSPVLKALILREEDKLGAEITNDAIQ
jgi:lysophospholipase L1-like esterase